MRDKGGSVTYYDAHDPSAHSTSHVAKPDDICARSAEWTMRFKVCVVDHAIARALKGDPTCVAL